jgi:hypothetical protein
MAQATQSEKLPEPKIRVVLPTSTLRLEHVTYLRNLTLPCKDRIKCELGWKEVNKLKLLGLVEEIEVPPDKKQVEDYKTACNKAIERLKALVVKENWVGIANTDLYALRRNEPKPSKENRITRAGKDLLRESNVIVKLQKGCA